MSDSFASANGPSVAVTTPFVSRTVLAWLPSASPAWKTSSPDSVSSLSRFLMNSIISTIHWRGLTSTMPSALPNIITMYFTGFSFERRPWSGAF